MSTFKGVVSEFPNIRIDFFRRGDNLPPPLACFLSHVHSDHLMGLESLKAPFVYCSPATREILLRLEKYPSRMNFAKGILETRRQTYRHLKQLLKTIPLETPTTIELSPGNEIKVTLFDANHCVGAVMFLIEGNGKAILYTGDIRSEDWWIQALAQKPTLLPYAAGIKKLDNIYLDTTFATKEKIYSKFPSKADGIAELLQKVALYPNETIFYFHSWTFGYENVWLALSSFVDSRIHLDPYRWSLYKSLNNPKGGPECPEAVQFYGFALGNHFNRGCLTEEPGARIHSCERATGCPIIDENSNIVTILPIVTRRDDGLDVHEMGIGGGQGDLDQVQEVDVQDEDAVQRLLALCAERINDSMTLDKVQTMLETCSRSRRAQMKLHSHINRIDYEGMEEEKKLTSVVDELAILVENSPPTTGENLLTNLSTSDILPRIITFPYSRHSSYFELRALVAALKPREVFPCTVDEINWNPQVSVESLFGDLCTGIGNHFQHDQEMRIKYVARIEPESQISHNFQETQNSFTLTSEAESQVSEIPYHTAPLREDRRAEFSDQQPDNVSKNDHLSSSKDKLGGKSITRSSYSMLEIETSQLVGKSSKFDTVPGVAEISPPPIKRLLAQTESSSNEGRPSKIKREKSITEWAYEAAQSGTWHEFGGLVCTKPQDSQELNSGETEEEP
jgi:DNA cross-link repair 1C protein